MSAVIIDVKVIYGEVAKLSDIPKYVENTLELAGSGNDVEITGGGPIWLYLVLAHALHGKATSLTYNSHVTGKVEIFNHNPF